jgi:predicted nuclease of predicted toxin-antitoxin system
MRFKVDESLPEEAADLLRVAGHDAHSIHEERLAGALDQRVAEVAQAEHRTLVTLDLDFADVRRYPPPEYAGIVVIRLSRQDKLHVLATMRRVTPLFATEPVAGRLWIVEDERIRIR